jgi:hypothetical protein
MDIAREDPMSLDSLIRGAVARPRSTPSFAVDRQATELGSCVAVPPSLPQPPVPRPSPPGTPLRPPLIPSCDRTQRSDASGVGTSAETGVDRDRTPEAQLEDGQC